MKVDIEGYEAIAFKGCQQLLSRPNAPVIVFEFCDWAEARSPNLSVGEAQRVLAGFGYQIWRLNDLVAGRQPLSQILEHGSETLVGIKNGNLRNP
jgi:hypothetical protein